MLGEQPGLWQERVPHYDQEFYRLYGIPLIPPRRARSARSGRDQQTMNIIWLYLRYVPLRRRYRNRMAESAGWSALAMGACIDFRADFIAGLDTAVACSTLMSRYGDSGVLQAEMPSLPMPESRLAAFSSTGVLGCRSWKMPIDAAAWSLLLNRAWY